MPKKSKESKIVSVETAEDSGGYIKPLIVRFQHADVKDSSFVEMKPEIVVNREPNSNQSRINLSLKSNFLSYSNTAPSVQEIPCNRHRKTYLAVRNKVTNKVRLIEAEIKPVGPDVKMPEKTANPLLLKVALEEEDESKKESRMTLSRHLITEFGQAKGKRFFEQADRMNVKMEQIEQKLITAAGTVEASSLVIEDNVKSIPLIPNCNRNTTDIYSVYQIQDLLNDDEITLLENHVQKLCQSYNSIEEVKEAVKKKIISELFGYVLKREWDKSDYRKSAIALYMESLIKFLRLRPTEFKKGPLRALPQYIPASIRQKTFDTFTLDGCVTPETKDKVICYIIILALLSCNLVFDLNALSSSVYAKVDKMKKLIQVTGASLEADVITGQSSVILKFPLSTYDVNKVLRSKKKTKKSK